MAKTTYLHVLKSTMLKAGCQVKNSLTVHGPGRVKALPTEYSCSASCFRFLGTT